MIDFVNIQDNKLIIDGTDQKFLIKSEENIELYLGEKKIERPTFITKDDEVIILGNNEEASRNLKINISKDKLRAYITIEYTDGKKVIPAVKVKENVINIVASEIEIKKAPYYSRGELLETLRESNIRYGLKKEVLDTLNLESNLENILIAEGTEAVNDEEDRIEIKFENVKRAVEADSDKRVDYKNFYTTVNVNAGQIIAEKIIGKVGKDGIDIYGNVLTRKIKHNIKFKAAEGCKQEGNFIIAKVEGRPTIKNGIFTVNKVFTIGTNVDLKSGNVNFIGDVEISGCVKGGMTVKAGNSVNVEQHVESASIIAQGEVTIKGNVLNSRILAGAMDEDKQQYLESLIKYKEAIENLINAVEQLKTYNKFSLDKSDGELIKLLMDTKYTKLQRESMLILTVNRNMGNGNEEIDKFIREKVVGANVLKIKYVNEFYELIELLQDEIKIISDEINIPVDIYVSYCQDSRVKSSGSIIITGKGQYVSELIANKNIEFRSDNSICRGGVLTAGEQVIAKTIGSPAGVTTKVIVPRKGVIIADIAYNNSIFIFGERQYIVERPIKDVKAYMNKQGEIVVDKLML